MVLLLLLLLTIPLHFLLLLIHKEHTQSLDSPKPPVLLELLFHLLPLLHQLTPLVAGLTDLALVQRLSHLMLQLQHFKLVCLVILILLSVGLEHLLLHFMQSGLLKQRLCLRFLGLDILVGGRMPITLVLIIILELVLLLPPI